MTSPFRSPVLDIDRQGAIATLWLDRPEARNAMGPDFWTDLPRAMATLSADDSIRVVVVAARGPHFSVGLDLKAMAGLLMDPGGGTASPAGATGAGATGAGATGAGDAVSPATRARVARQAVRRMQAAIDAVADCPKPVVAAVHGYCIGGGVDLITACDIRLAADDAVLSVREVKMAIVADLGSLQRLPRIVGASHVAELAFTGRDITAGRAREIGLVNDVVEGSASGVHQAAVALAAEIAANSPLAVQGTKAVLAACADRSIAEGLDYVATWNAGMLASDDLREAVTAFFEKRPAHYTGR
jgi:enoyl-CoA hydratase